MNTRLRMRTVSSVAAVASFAVAIPFALISAPSAQAYQNSQLCVLNFTAETVRANFVWGPVGSLNERTGLIRPGNESCETYSRAGGPDVSVGIKVGKSAYDNRNRPIFKGTTIGRFFVNNPAVGWPVIAGRVQGYQDCSWDTYTSTCWYARLGQQQHRCLQEGAYWARPSREADSGGAKQFRVAIYDASTMPATFGC